MYVVFEKRTKELYIKKLDMSGKSITENFLETGKLMGPKISLAYDFKYQKLYWADEGTGRIESISDQGSLTKVFLHYFNLFL